jgi:DNA topoisomerase-1
VVRELDDLPGYEIFRYYNDDGELVNVRSEDLNNYIKDIMGHEFSAKDFRTWAGTLIAAVALDELGVDPRRGPLKRHVVAAVKQVAERLGNTPSIAKASYIDPRVIEHYLNGTTIRIYLQQIDTAIGETELSPEEAAVLQLMQRRLRKDGGDKA